MPKMKTKSLAKKRFKVTASGKIKRAKAYRRHLIFSIDLCSYKKFEQIHISKINQ